MKTLLIVEDEKLIRQGIHVMAKRSQVPIEEILECSNGVEALEILEKQHVDVMFTDIRMQQMDGLELVSKVSALPNPPLMVAISGYDDFSYAVEMLRNGVREYLLKPVEREKIKEVLEKLDKELTQKNQKEEENKSLSTYQLKSLLTDHNLDSQEKEILVKKNEKFFIQEPYRVCLIGSRVLVEEDGGGIYINNLPEGQLAIIKNQGMDEYIADELEEITAGISGVHNGIAEVDVAFKEAVEARGNAFAMSHTLKYEDISQKVPEDMRQQALELLTSENRTKRIQVLGASKTDEVINLWSTLFRAASYRHITIDEFTSEMQQSFGEISGLYKETIERGDEEIIRQCMNPLSFDNIDEYKDAIMDWLLDVSARLGSRFEDNGVRQKMLQAEAYIKENYGSDLNMAVVSNYVSMNYSFFSYSFKQHTGQNFVNYLKMIRMNEAKKLLTETDMKIVEISSCVGYDNEKHFMKTFKAVMGVSPGTYRKNMRTGNN
ncbi:MAG: response regulator [Pseudobutyrivibrio sp.]|nr:response regulator [Pseudobutyrivibrio sp.]